MRVWPLARLLIRETILGGPYNLTYKTGNTTILGYPCMYTYVYTGSGVWTRCPDGGRGSRLDGTEEWPPVGHSGCG